MIREALLHFAWQHQCFDTDSLKTTDGQSIRILNIGQTNANQGPDFLNAKLKIGSVLWVGDIEIHQHEKEWYAHKHDRDEHYNSCILHIVYQRESVKGVQNQQAQVIPTLNLKDCLHKGLLQKYRVIEENKHKVPCAPLIEIPKDIKLSMFYQRLAIERLEFRTQQLQLRLEKLNNNWEQLFLIQLCRYFGMKVNNDAFEALGELLNVQLISKIKENSGQLEALIFGLAGLLNDDLGNPYYQLLKQEYCYLKKRFSLENELQLKWKYLRLRPANFPLIRLAQLAALLCEHPRLFSKLLSLEKLKDFECFFAVEPNPFWKTHYSFDKKSKPGSKKMGKQFIHNLLINVVMPTMFFYGKSKGISVLEDRALLLLETVKAEKNTIVKHYQDLGFKSTSALESQALLQLNQWHCTQFKCLGCQIGQQILAK